MNTGSSKINGAKFSDTCFVRANWLCMGWPFCLAEMRLEFKTGKFLRACMLVYKTTPTFLLGKREENIVDRLQMVVPKFCKNTVNVARNNVQTCSLVVFILIRYRYHCCMLVQQGHRPLVFAPRCIGHRAAWRRRNS